MYVENVQFQRADVFNGFYLHKNAYAMDAGSVLYICLFYAISTVLCDGCACICT